MVAGALNSTFLKAPTKTFAQPRLAKRVARKMNVRAGTEYPQERLEVKPYVLALGFLGWAVPASIPVGALGGGSLTSLFKSSITQELAHFPTGPALTDKFWLYLVLWHVGLFTSLFLAQIGYQARTRGYFN